MAYRLAIRGRFDCCVPLFQLLKVEKRLGDIQPERERGGWGGGEGRGGDGKRGKPPPKDGEIWGEDRRNEEREGERLRQKGR